MTEWAYVLGRCFQASNWLYKQFFITRGANVPEKLIGHTYCQLAYKNPSQALAQFNQAFGVCLAYCEKHDQRVKGLWQFRSLQSSLYELTKGELPKRPTDKDRILLQMGYSYFNKDSKSKDVNDE